MCNVLRSVLIGRGFVLYLYRDLLTHMVIVFWYFCKVLVQDCLRFLDKYIAIFRWRLDFCSNVISYIDRLLPIASALNNNKGKLIVCLIFLKQLSKLKRIQYWMRLLMKLILKVEKGISFRLKLFKEIKCRLKEWRWI